MDDIALIGIGYWGSKLRGYIKEHFNLKYVADSNFDKNIIWGDDDVGSVIIATPIDTHYAIAKEALEHYKNVFVEKPITMTYGEAIELKEIACKKDRHIAVEYTQTFSKSIKMACKRANQIGKLRYIEMSVKHLGRFLNYNVYWLLASHQLSILDLFINLNELKFSKEDHIFNGPICTSGTINFWNNDIHGKIDVSLNFPSKEIQTIIYGDNGTIIYSPLTDNSLTVCRYNKRYAKLSPELIDDIDIHCLDEKNNLKYAIEYFKDVLDNKANSNVDSAIKITKILEGLQ